MEAQRHVSLLQHLFFFPSVTFTCFRSSLHGGGHCIPMGYKSSFKSSCSDVQLISTVNSAVLRHMFLGSYNHAVMLALNHGISLFLAHIVFTSIGMFKIWHIVSKRSISFRQSNSCKYSLVGVSCLLFSFT